MSRSSIACQTIHVGSKSRNLASCELPAGLALCVFAFLFGGNLGHFHQTEAADCGLFPFHRVDFWYPDPCGGSVTYGAPSLLHIEAACLQSRGLPLSFYDPIVTGGGPTLKVIPRNQVDSSLPRFLQGEW